MPLDPTPPPIADPALPLPSLADRPSYGPRRREWLRWEHENLTPGMLAFAANVYANAAHAQEMAEMAAAMDNYAGIWSTLTGALAVPASTYHDGDYWVLLESLADVTAEEPSELSTVWTLFQDGAVQKSGDTMTGHLNVPAGATGTQVPQAQEVMGIVGGAKLPEWTTAGRPASPGANRVFGFNTDLGCIEHWNGTYWVQEGWQSSGLITLTGSQVDQAIPPWAREISIDLYDSSSTSPANYVVQLGTSGGIVTANYRVFSSAVSASAVQSGSYSTSGFLINASDSTGTVNGTLNLRRSASNLWVGDGGFARGTGARISTSGNVDLGAAVTTARLLRTAGTWSGTAYMSWRR